MKVTILGCATSTGVPIIGCGCSVCTSDNPKNNRTRCSCLIRVGGNNILIDTSTDLRIQALKHALTRIDAVLYTHAHADHTHGIDELRTFNYVNKMVIPCFGNLPTVLDIKHKFKYVFDGSHSAGGKPKLKITPVKDDFYFKEIKIVPVEIRHGRWDILGYRIGDMAYLTDCSEIPDRSFAKLKGLDVLIISALRYKPHESHFSVNQAVGAVRRIQPRRAVLTHLSHDLDYDTLATELPEGMIPAYDGMEIELKEP